MVNCFTRHALKHYFKEVELVDQAIATGESGELQNTSTIVRSSHFSERQAEAEDFVVGVTRLNKEFDNQGPGWFEGTVTAYLPKEKW